jgi:sulfite exporter TauE/SafE
MAGAAVAGLVGSLHCVGMCGGFAVACGARPADIVFWHAGRLVTYAVLGTAAGAFGAIIPGPGWVVGVVSTALIVWFAAALAGLVREPTVVLPGVQRMGTALARRTGALPRLAFGMANGLLPCGLVYATLSIPIALTSPALGALAMVLFGLGTVPALTVMSLGLHRFAARDLRVRRALALGVLIAGLWSIGARQGVLASPMGGHGGHGEMGSPPSTADTCQVSAASGVCLPDSAR